MTRNLLALRTALALAAALAALLAGAAAAASQYEAPDPGGDHRAKVRVPPPGKLFGLNELISGGAFGVGPGTYAGLARLAGANTIRTLIDWRLAEPERDMWDEAQWEKWQHAYNAASAAGLRPILVVGLAPWWARDPEYQGCMGLHLACRFPPSRGMYDEWMEFVNEVVVRFPWAVIQVWNEPNLRPWWGSEPEPERYAELLHWAHWTAKRINSDVAVVASVSANLDGVDGMPVRAFLERAYRAPEPYDLRASMDLLGVNLYPYSNRFGKDTALAKALKDIRDAREAAGDETPLLVTETGIGSGAPWPYTERQQARASMRLYRKLVTMDDVAGVVFHRIIEPGERGKVDAAPREWGYAWIRFDTSPLEPKPVYCLFAERARNFYPPCLAIRVKGPRLGAPVKRGGRAVFRLRVPALYARLRCAIDGRRMRPCRRRFNAGRLRPGRHVLRVRAIDRNGNRGELVRRRFAVRGAK